MKRDQVLPFTSSSLQLEEDLIRLNTLNEAVISFNLEHRYMEGQVYVSKVIIKLTKQTNIGPMVVSVNPFQPMDNLYSESKIHDYTEEDTALPPHLFSVANKAYNHLTSFGR